MARLNLYATLKVVTYSDELMIKFLIKAMLKVLEHLQDTVIFHIIIQY